MAKKKAKARPKKTSVELSDKAQAIRDQHAHLTTRQVLSAGLILFDQQDDTGKLKALAQAFEGE